jgi:hypothetical protein
LAKASAEFNEIRGVEISAALKLMAVHGAITKTKRKKVRVMDLPDPG